MLRHAKEFSFVDSVRCWPLFDYWRSRDDVAFIDVIPTPTGRTIRFATNRPILFGEAFFDTRSKDYNVTTGEIEINDSDKKKNTGFFFPAAQLVINKEGQLEFQVGNPEVTAKKVATGPG